MSMSASEYATIMREVGMTTPGVAGSGDSIRVDHVITVGLDRGARKLADAALELGRHFLVAFQLVAVGCAGFLLLYGTAELIHAVRGIGREGGGNEKKHGSGGGSGKKERGRGEIIKKGSSAAAVSSSS